MRRSVALVLGAMVGLFTAAALLLSAGPAAAAGEGVQGFVRNGTAPVAGVKITVTKADGSPAGEATTAATGRWVVELPGPGSYKVSIDQKTLPKGVTLTDQKRSELTVAVSTDERKTLLFPLGKGVKDQSHRLSRAWALTVEGVRFGLIIALASLGLSVIYGTTGLTNFAHGELITLGALLAFVVNVTWNLPIEVALILAVIVAGVLGGLLDILFWRWLRHRGTGLIGMMIISIGLAILLRYLYLAFFGGSTRSFHGWDAWTVDIGSATLSEADVISVIIAIMVLAAASYGLLATRMGKATRAVADNPALAAASGIDVERVINVVWITGTALAALSGVLLGLSQQINYQMGFQILLLIFAAVTLGGLGTAFGAIIGSLVVGLFIQLSTLVIPSELKNVGALGVLIVLLLIRPQGLMGRRERIG